MIKRELVQIENISVDELTEIIAEKLVINLKKDCNAYFGFPSVMFLQ